MLSDMPPMQPTRALSTLLYLFHDEGTGDGVDLLPSFLSVCAVDF